MSVDIGVNEFTETVLTEDLLPPCEYAEETWNCQQGAAEWVLHCTPCACGAGGFRLACTPCKDARLFGPDDDFVECEHCGALTVPARAAYFHVEPLGHRR